MQHKKLPSNPPLRGGRERGRRFALQISLRGVEISNDIRPSNQSSLYKIAIPDKVRERKYPWIYCCGATLSMGEGAAGAFALFSLINTPLYTRKKWKFARQISLCGCRLCCDTRKVFIIYPHENFRYLKSKASTIIFARTVASGFTTTFSY